MFGLREAIAQLFVDAENAPRCLLSPQPRKEPLHFPHIVPLKCRLETRVRSSDNLPILSFALLILIPGEGASLADQPVGFEYRLPSGVAVELGIEFLGL